MRLNFVRCVKTHKPNRLYTNASIVLMSVMRNPHAVCMKGTVPLWYIGTHTFLFWKIIFCRYLKFCNWTELILDFERNLLVILWCLLWYIFFWETTFRVSRSVRMISSMGGRLCLQYHIIYKIYRRIIRLHQWFPKRMMDEYYYYIIIISHNDNDYSCDLGATRCPYCNYY